MTTLVSVSVGGVVVSPVPPDKMSPAHLAGSIIVSDEVRSGLSSHLRSADPVRGGLWVRAVVGEVAVVVEGAGLVVVVGVVLAPARGHTQPLAVREAPDRAGGVVVEIEVTVWKCSNY